MDLFRNIRLKVGKSMLSGKTGKANRKPAYTNFQNIKSIGLVWDAYNPIEFMSLSKLHQRMSEKDIEVSIFGYYEGKELPAQYTAIRYLTCLKKKETDFFYRPLSQFSDDFIARKFDVLIDLNFRNRFPLYYISTLSQARFKVGLAGSNPESTPFDLMISTKGTLSIDNYLEQVMVYLEMINSETANKSV